MFLYCPPNITLNEIWIDHGVSQCFMDTVSTSITAGFLLIFGTIQLWIYKKYSTTVSAYTLPKSKLYNLQLFLLIILPILSCARLILQATLLKDHVIYGYMIVATSLISLSSIYSIALVLVERKYMLPSVPTRGHGIVLLTFWTLLFITENLAFLNLKKEEWWFKLETLTDKIEMGLFVSRYVTCLLIFIIGLKAPGLLSLQDFYDGHPGSRLLRDDEDEDDTQGSTFKNFWRKVKLITPYVWPKKDHLLQLIVVFCFGLLMAGRVLNLLVPIYGAKIVDSMAPVSGTDTIEFRWDLVLIYIGFKLLQGGGTGGQGTLNNLRTLLWIKVQQYTTREVEVDLFRHLHSLSLRWHLGRKTGEVLRIMDRGTDSINNVLNYILFSIFPTLVDVLIAVVYCIIHFNIWFGVIVFVTIFLYLLFTIIVTEWRTKFIRQMNLADNAQNARSVDSLLNFETVKYYGAEEYEVNAYKDCILTYQKEEWKSNATLSLLNTMQNIVICGGLLAGSLLCVHLVTQHKLTVGDYVLFSSYILQLYVPLNWFGTYYRMIQKNFIDMENMFSLLNEEEEVIDAPGAGDLMIKRGTVEFNNVSFSYVPERAVLHNISFAVPPGRTVALVGPSGSGKSTIIRLLYRFYDVENGSIVIDGQNIKTVTQKSLRQTMGVVPQDTVLFNNTIKYNIQYGRVDATDQEIIEAAKHADIHDKIMTFPNGYDTQVGERGLKLSGGEKQRIAIARTILKSPVFVLLDEATSALDTQTERNIQAALSRVCVNRTTIIVAHRLSTIIHADEILVLKEGEIIERGRHDELLSFGGAYADMWQKQLKNDDKQPEDKQEE